MVQAIINISEDSNRVLNVVKAKYGLKDKSAAIDRIVKEFSNELLEPELRPEYLERASRIDKQTTVKIGTIENLRKLYG
ncbi:DUF2683 family protein [Candidatus Woesearchaeota archaeon]|nr:DUF2683 family protein [Candidatus Woesearchaeota archaeon]